MRGWITDPNAPQGLRLADDLPELEAGPDELVIDVRAFSINRGELGLVRLRPDGFRPGQDVAGVVSQAATNGGPAVGTRVVGIVDWHGWAEHVPALANWVAPIPDNVSFAAACTLPVAGLTALRALQQGGNLLGKRVLITGATGGVGQFALQMAVAAGARVTAQVSSEQRFDEALALGAHNAVVEVDEHAGPFWLVLEGVGGKTLVNSLHRLEPGGALALYGTVGGTSEIALRDFASAPGARMTAMFLRNSPAARIGDELGLMAALIGDGRLRPLIGLQLDWTQTQDAVKALGERGVRGKAVLTRE